MAPAASVSGDVINYKASAGDIGDFPRGGGGYYRKVKISTNSNERENIKVKIRIKHILRVIAENLVLIGICGSVT